MEMAMTGRLMLLLALAAATAVANDDSDLDLPVVLENYKARPVAQTTSTQPVVRPVHLPPPTTDDPKDQPDPVFFGEDVRSESASVVLVVDVSGSMCRLFRGGAGGETRLRLDVAFAEATRFLHSLPPTWRFGLVAYDHKTYVWRQGLAQATRPNEDDALRWLTYPVGVHGGTQTGPAVALALSLDRSNRSIVLLTDGSVARPDWHRQMIRDANQQRAVIDVFGIVEDTVMDYYVSMRSFCIGVASDSGGSYHEVK
jgi:hypothetical protein